MRRRVLLYVAVLLFCLLLQLEAGLGDRRRKRRPNIVVFLSDDQDILLGSVDVMHQTQERIINAGATFSNAFTTSPICCPSRSSFLTGLYAHNHNVVTNNVNCSSATWQKEFETRTFATYVKDAGYTTGYFGKYLNEYDGNHIPAGWDYWMGLLRNTKYYNYTLRHNERKERHGDDYAKDYLTDLVVNRSADHFVSCKRKNPDKPILSVLSFPAPHGKEDGAPQYQHLYANVTSHITPSFNYVPNPDKHWLLRQFLEPMDETQHRFSVMLQQKRLQTLRSVDDAIEKFMTMLADIGELDNTYVIYTSDHGFHIGQFGLAKGKSMPYDFDIRVPLFMRGPNIQSGSVLNDIVLNIDVAPTILSMVGIEPPEWMDGRNFLPLLSREGRESLSPKWRESFLVERGKIPTSSLHQDRPAVPSKQEKINQACAKPEFKYPCEKKQIWTCVIDGGALRMRKCNKFREAKTPRKPRRPRRCPCPPTESKAVVLRLSKKCKVRLSRINRAIDRVLTAKSKRKYRRQARFNPGPWTSTFRGLASSSEASMLLVKSDRFDIPRGKRQTTFDPMMSSGNQNQSSMSLVPGCEINTLTNQIVCSRSPSNDRRWKQRVKVYLDRSIEHMSHRIKYMRTVQRCAAASRTQFNARPVKRCRCPSPAPTTPKPLTPVKNPLREIQEERAVHRKRMEDLRNITRIRSKYWQEKKRKNANGSLDAERCGEPKVMCFRLTRNRWVTPPRWEGEEKCYCTNANNNTYWCVRIINATTNALYCKFVTKFEEFYDLNKDPHQLTNTYSELDHATYVSLNAELARLRLCKGLAQCEAPSNSQAEPVQGSTNPQSTTATRDSVLTSARPLEVEPALQTTTTRGRGVPAVPTNYPPGSRFIRNWRNSHRRKKKHKKHHPPSTRLDLARRPGRNRPETHRNASNCPFSEVWKNIVC